MIMSLGMTPPARPGRPEAPVRQAAFDVWPWCCSKRPADDRPGLALSHLLAGYERVLGSAVPCHLGTGRHGLRCA